MSESNWDKIQKEKPQDTTKFRDVYADQQLDRSKIEKTASMTSRTIFSIVMSVFICAVAYFVTSGCAWLMSNASSLMPSSTASSEASAVVSVAKKDSHNVSRLFYIIDENGDKKPDDGVYYDEQDDALAAWSKIHPESVKEDTAVSDDKSSFVYAIQPNFLNVLIALAAGGLAFVLFYQMMIRNYQAQQMLSDTADINQYQNDQHIALPEEIQRKFDWFPDVGAHSAVSVSSMISHIALENKGLGKFNVTKRVTKDIVDEDGNVQAYKGEICYDDNGNPVSTEKPMIDTAFMEALFDASGLPKDKELRKYYDATKIPYNSDGSNRDKLGKYKTVADLINADWELPYYEPQRPAGAYLVDTAPVNTIKFAKGYTA